MQVAHAIEIVSVEASLVLDSEAFGRAAAEFR
jgi:hypothetical protein